ncbi:MAG: CerR family C-terminal domain-containing protein [Proteobacteria bacterium]|nr:CerR family C-terminal domain-containing protein [Pseudomonadota bacterium]
MNRQNEITVNTRTKILEKAGEVFTECGFQNATIREICRRANVNIAAINYHFRDKDNLYLATLRYWRSVAFEKYPPDLGIKEADTPEERLRAFVHSFVFRILEEGPTSWFGKLVAREYVQPTKALDVLVEETIRPGFTLLASIVRGLLEKQANKSNPPQSPSVSKRGEGGFEPFNGGAAEFPSDETVQFCCASIVSQFLYFLYARPIIKRLFNKDFFETEEIKKIADHITLFSLHAIKAIAENGKGEQP